MQDSGVEAPERQNGYHHFSLTFGAKEVGERFADVRFVLVGGCPYRAQAMAAHLAAHLPATQTGGGDAHLLTGERSRFVLLKVGPVLVANHGMGPASMSIAVHELLHMCQRAQVIDRVTFIRFGTCGGLGVTPGTVCVTNKAVDSLLQDFIELKICLRTVRRPCTIDERTCAELFDCGRRQAAISSQANDPEQREQYEVRAGATLSTGDFYEEQGRTNGAICEHSLADRMHFLEAAAKFGVINMEMESTHLAAMCSKLGVSFGVVCVALNNRLLGDQMSLSHSQVERFERRLFRLVELYLSEKLAAAA